MIILMERYKNFNEVMEIINELLIEDETALEINGEVLNEIVKEEYEATGKGKKIANYQYINGKMTLFTRYGNCSLLTYNKILKYLRGEYFLYTEMNEDGKPGASYVLLENEMPIVDEEIYVKLSDIQARLIL